MKKLLLFMMAAVLILSGCGGKTGSVERKIGDSAVYSKAEIQLAMGKVVNRFSKGFDGCTLLELEYDEVFSLERAEAWARQYQADEAIVLKSSFFVDASGCGGCMNPNSVYENYQWVLTRNKWGTWQLQTWGYG